MMNSNMKTPFLFYVSLCERIGSDGRSVRKLILVCFSLVGAESRRCFLWAKAGDFTYASTHNSPAHEAIEAKRFILS